MAELKLSGNHLKGSRPVLSFHRVCSKPRDPATPAAADKSVALMAHVQGLSFHSVKLILMHTFKKWSFLCHI